MNPDTITHTIEMQPTAVMNEFNAGIITRDTVERRIASFKAFSKLATGQEHTARSTSRWGKAATELERALKRHPSSQAACLRMLEVCIAVEDDDDASEDELALCAICNLKNNLK